MNQPLATPVIRPRPETASAVEIEGLFYRPPGRNKDLFQRLDWSVTKGESVGLVGVNGVGKTMLARLIRGLARPAAGTVKVAGRSISSVSVSALASSVTYTFQEPANLFMKTRVDEELSYSGRLLGLQRAVAARRTEETLERFGLGAHRREHPRELPGGLAGLLGVALSWYGRAPLQILDEPLARLDRDGRVILESVIASWRAEGTTAIVIAHDLDWLCAVCTRLTVLDAGEIVAEGSADEVFSRAAVRQRLGRPILLEV